MASKIQNRDLQFRRRETFLFRLLWILISLSILILLLSFNVSVMELSGKVPEKQDGIERRSNIYKELVTPLWISGDAESYSDNLSLSLGKILRLSSLNNSGTALQGLFWKEKDYAGRLVFTFDDGPNLDLIPFKGREVPVTEAILDLLDKYGIQAVFFINGNNLDFSTPGKARQLRILLNRMIRQGHLLGNHSYHHYNLAKGIFHDGVRDKEDIRVEFQTTQDTLNSLLGYTYPLILIRPPYAEPGRTATLDSILIEDRQFLISLHFDSYDYAYSPGGYWQYDRLQSHIRDIILPSRGGLLLMHDLETTVPLLEKILKDPQIFPDWEISTVSELLEEKYGQ